MKEVAITLNTDSSEIDRKLKNVYSQYTRERRNNKAMKKSGARKEFHTKCFGYALMSFLQDKNKPRKAQEFGLVEWQVCININYYITLFKNI